MLTTLHAALARLPGFAALPPDTLEPMPRKGVAHDHVRLKGRGLVARVPRWSQMGLDPVANLNQQAAAFRRAAPSGHTPELVAVLAPAEGLPMGALIVTEVVGRSPRLPGDMPAIARALAALHRLPLPEPEARAPLPAPADPVAATLAHVERQAVWFERAGLAPEALGRIRAELAAAQAFRLTPPIGAPMPVTLVGSDVHPGNFLIDPSGKAWFTDLEKLQYGHPAIDLAHASLYTSTKWEREVAAALSPEEVAVFHAAWDAAVPPALAQSVRPWLRPLRRLTWLRTLSWMARWAVEGAALSPDMPESLAVHMDAHATDVLRPDIIERVSRDWW
ncbi:phosphotransferase [Azospirillum sp. sgz302134]